MQCSLRLGSWPAGALLLKITPNHPIILHPITPIERGLVGDRALDGAAGEGVVKDRAADDAGSHVLNVLPAGGLVDATARPLPREAHTRQPLAGCEDDAAIAVVPGVAFVLLHHRELHAVDGDQFIEGELEGLGHQHIDLHQGLAAGVIGSQGAVALPGGGEVGEEAVGQAGILFGPALCAEGVVPALAPEVGVVGGEAVEGKGA